MAANVLLVIIPNQRKIVDLLLASHAMPLGNETGITDAERAEPGAWIKAGAKVP